MLNLETANRRALATGAVVALGTAAARFYLGGLTALDLAFVALTGAIAAFVARALYVF